MKRALASLTVVASLASVTAIASAPTAVASTRATSAVAVPSEPGRVRWRLKLPGDYAAHRPVVAPDGTIYASLTAGGLYAVNPDGTLKWKAAGGSASGVSGPIDVGSDGTLYAASGVVTPDGLGSDGVAAINPDGTRKWLFAGSGDYLIAGPSVGPDGNIYAVTDWLGIGFFSLSPAGKLRFSTGRFTEHGALGQEIAFGPDRAYFAFDMQGTGSMSSLFGYTLNGGKVFQVGSPAGNAEPRTGPNGNAVIPNFPSNIGLSLAAFNSNGRQLWNFYEFPGNTEENADVGPDNVAYTVRNLRSVYALDPNGTVRWRYDSEPGIVFEPAVSPNNDLILMGGQVTYGEPGLFLAVGTDGRPLFRVDIPDEPGFEPYGQVVPEPTRPAFSPNGTSAYSVADVRGDGSTGTYAFLYAIDTTVAGGTTPPPVTPTVPAAPSNLRVTGVTASRIALAWTDEATNEDGFRVFRCRGTSCTDFTRIATVGANVTSFSSGGLSSRTTYRYKVRAYNAAGSSAASNTVSAKTQ